MRLFIAANFDENIIDSLVGKAALKNWLQEDSF